MPQAKTLAALTAACALLAACGGGDAPAADTAPPKQAQAAPRPGPAAEDGGLLLTANASGIAATLHTSGSVDTSGPFFQSLGSNGRTCASCHVQAEGWTLTPAGLRRRFAQSGGTDPVFRPNDGATSPDADVSTVAARRSAYAMLLSKGLVRVGLPVPAGAEFELVAVDDPYGHASAAELSLFRRPLPTTNLNFLSTVMWDGRETLKDPASTDCIAGTVNCFASVHFDLADQSNTATVGHAQAATPLTDAQRSAIVDFETGLFTAQWFDRDAGRLDEAGAGGGPRAASAQPFYFGINDTLAGDYRSGAPFTNLAMTLFDAWTHARGPRAAARQAVARGQALFNGHPISIAGVKGLNDDLGVATIQGTCTTCHDAPNAGDHSVPMPLDIGIADAARRSADLPLYTLRHRTTGETLQTSDPGRALVSGKWKDIGRFKGPVLRALAARAPYFHNGMAADLAAVVEFYDTRFEIGFTPQEKSDLVAFLRTL